MPGASFPLPAFPSGQPDAPARATSFAVPDIRLRHAEASDLPFLRQLYGTLRAQELAQTGWPDDLQHAFLDSQFAFQHRDFVTSYAAADFYLVQCGDEAIGRYYLLRQRPSYLVIDIALLPAWRGQGIGGDLLAWTQQLVARDNQATGIDLHVDERNIAAQRLYARLGFQVTTHSSPYFAMHWPREQTSQLNTA
ncbi:GNAT family N-acetyltransferase [Dyella monticola]|uniref:GNAT family N-acetyltransferase n=2 Tax=Dyella monticola TaxID=1927958 RepID=A0A370X011_9GAMM|nr:GNAT family N-acetyltransferase [Dyella monticola]